MGIVIPQTSGANSFEGRAANGQKFSQKIFDDLSAWSFIVAKNGTEHTHPDFVKRLHASNDVTSLMIRYAPDGVISAASRASTKSAYVEAKNSTFIEKAAYENYMRIYCNGGIVAVVFADFTIRFEFIENLQFASRLTNWPLDNEGWECPRLHPDWQRVRRKYPGSGTPFKKIRWGSLRNWDEFRDAMEARWYGDEDS